MRLAEFLRRVGAVAALLGTGCLLVAPVLSRVYFESDRVIAIDRGGSRLGVDLLFYLLPLLGACVVAVEGLQAWHGSAATRAGVARLLLGCTLCGLAAIPLVLLAGARYFIDGLVMLASVDPGPLLASLGFLVVLAGGVLLALYSGGQSRLLLAEALRHVGSVVALLGIGCLLLAPLLLWVHFTPDPRLYRPSDREGVVPGDYSLVGLLVTSNRARSSLAAAALTLYLLPGLGACLVVVEALRAWRGSAATRERSARLLLLRLVLRLLLLLGMSCALFGLAAIPALVQVVLGIVTGGSVMPAWWVWVAEGPSFASAGFSAVVAGGVLLAIGALLHRWTLRRNDQPASTTTTG